MNCEQADNFIGARVDGEISHADRAALLGELAQIRESGTALDREEHEAGIRCVAAPVFDAGRALVAGVSVTGPTYRVSEVQLLEWAPRVLETARAIMGELAAKLGPQR